MADLMIAVSCPEFESDTETTKPGPTAPRPVAPVNFGDGSARVISNMHVRRLVRRFVRAQSLAIRRCQQ